MFAFQRPFSLQSVFLGGAEFFDGRHCSGSDGHNALISRTAWKGYFMQHLANPLREKGDFHICFTCAAFTYRNDGSSSTLEGV